MESMLELIKDPEKFKEQLNVVQRRLAESHLQMYMLGLKREREMVVQRLLNSDDPTVQTVGRQIARGEHVPEGQEYDHARFSVDVDSTT